MINFYLLIKPGIILGNLITFAAGFFLASKGVFDIRLFIGTLLGLSCVIASACVFNNYIDRYIDQKMERTKNRVLATGSINAYNAYAFAVLIGLSGNLILLNSSNVLTTLLADLGFVVYVFLYSLLKSRTTYSTLIGSVSGAIPPVIGYTAVSNQIDAAAVILFYIMIFWQMPHFFAIGLWHQEDYTKAKLPILPVARGAHRTKVHMFLYILCLIPTLMMLSFFGYTGKFFFLTTFAASAAWLMLSIRGFKTDQNDLWGKQMFRFSLVVINAICLLIPFDSAS